MKKVSFFVSGATNHAPINRECNVSIGWRYGSTLEASELKGLIHLLTNKLSRYRPKTYSNLMELTIPNPCYGRKDEYLSSRSDERVIDEGVKILLDVIRTVDLDGVRPNVDHHRGDVDVSWNVPVKGQ